jgi:hypothetical protein
MRTLIFCCFVIVALASPASADKKAIYDYGSCGSWTEARAKGLPYYLPKRAWVQGYISALNIWDVRGVFDIIEGTDKDAITAWLDSYCQQHPIDHIADAAAKLADDLTARAAARAAANLPGPAKD